ncbi:methyltransferase domain-containing protein [Paenibacillus thiaminolyticus]|uniref:Methyltransferase domain-containing protein n=1 Tax=Paenibacillus thiaminolyticus TaxID=49283 RepID=A0AAP9DRY8_PANTH|nr:class I SAM-dependent methyltransferase [Paenibacillus thiaminolyticus]MCY9537844.1 methyltransferase domain-containing protein [Paenibacillus thiaminolyticus]MCY9605136.1 methyltransferase domain-containing protein [Paenibacillus thiaminolyticus]MCY9607177.1 methyltransferase domain-containing protein [Paenibacillus thiaminolyticus]MCY9616302.1 methyltransferase domain-containing protein [Paenibacillus thiaminolyticus]MCY9620045.1 methyltransferase domain-containing protein [Paenibacillus 
MLQEISRYWTSGAAGYNKVVQAQFRSRRTVERWKALLQEGLSEHKPQRILDAGTGPGFFSLLLAEMGHHLTAVDASPGMVDTAARNFKAAGLDIQVYEGDAAHLEREEDESYDAVVSRDVVWTLPDPAGAYNEWFRVLGPGGRLLLFDGNYLYQKQRGLRYLLRRAMAWMLILLTERRISTRASHDERALERLPFVQAARPEADIEALEQAGFTIDIVRTDYFPGYKQSLQYWKYGYQTDVRFMIVARKA